MTKNDFPSPLHKERQVQGAQLLWKINGAARCRESGEGVTSPWCSSPCWRGQSSHQRSMGDVDSSLHVEYMTT